ncbi:unnamed protein product [Diamesa tonsa]
MKVFLSFCLFFIALVAAVSRDNKLELTQEEIEFVQNYRDEYRNSIKYSDAKEDRKRADIILQRKEEIAIQNELFKEGKSSFKIGLNHYCYMDSDEFIRVMCGTIEPKEMRTYPALPQTTTMVYPPVPAANALALNWAPTLCYPIIDQGLCGCCWSTVAIAVVESMFKKLSLAKFKVPLSIQYLVDCDKGGLNKGCIGGWPTYALEFLKINGIATAATYPYAAIDTQAFLNYAGPVAVAINVCPGLELLKSGVYDNPLCPNNTVNHAVVLAGYGTENGIPYWLIRNTWGTLWGVQGYGKIARNKGNQISIASYAIYVSSF